MSPKLLEKVEAKDRFPIPGYDVVRTEVFLFGDVVDEDNDTSYQSVSAEVARSGRGDVTASTRSLGIL